MSHGMMIDRDAIARLIPHAGAMCLLDDVLYWDDASICCRSTRHRAGDNPLRQWGQLGGLCGIEFAAQAMAAHGRLAGAVEERPRAGYLASLRNVVCRHDRLDLLDDDLIVKATRFMGDEEHAMYAFAITCGPQELISGRATVLLRVERPR
jgi:predicted hotdog family 3-hydroxylacyl-ACP dehydratase